MARADGTICVLMLRKPLIRHHRGVARGALYLLPVMLVGVTLALASYTGSRRPDTSWHRVDYSRFESVRLFQEYLRFDTSYPDGNEIPAAE